MINSFFDAFRPYFPLLLDLWYIPALIILFSILNALKPKIIGHLGEKAIIYRLNKLPVENYKILNDVLIETPSGTSQIDHIVVSNYGVFVIETKCYNGWIFGSKFGKTWTQNIYGKKYKFQNPLHQNFGHIKRLEELDNCLNNINYISIIAFSGDGELKFEIDNVVNYTQLLNLIQSYTDVLYTDAQVEEIYNLINTNNILDRAKRREHVKKIKAAL